MSIKMKVLFLLLPLLFMLQGCFVTPPKGQNFSLLPANSNLGHVYVFRSQQEILDNMYAMVSIDNVPAGMLSPNAYLVQKLEPEDYLISLHWQTSLKIKATAYKRIETLIQVEAGQDYFIEVSSHYENGQYAWQFNHLSAGQALPKIKSNKKQQR